MIEARSRGRQAADILRDRIRHGVLAPGARLDETRLSQALGVSRTPLREGLGLLEAEGLIVHPPNRSRHVARLDAGQVRDLYRIIGALERAALRCAEPPGASAMARLRSLASGVLEAGISGAERQRRDAGFHIALCALTANDRLIELRRIQGDLALLYDGGHERGIVALEQSAAEHGRVLECLQAGCMADAAQLLEDHWEAGADAVTRWIAEGGDPA